MKKAWSVIWILALMTAVIAWGVAGVKILDGEYDITLECWIALIASGVMVAINLGRKLNSKCPHCGKIRLSGGDYCAYCGKRIIP